jgi:hypothetical protein
MARVDVRTIEETGADGKSVIREAEELQPTRFPLRGMLVAVPEGKAAGPEGEETVAAVLHAAVEFTPRARPKVAAYIQARAQDRSGAVAVRAEALSDDALARWMAGKVVELRGMPPPPRRRPGLANLVDMH